MGAKGLNMYLLDTDVIWALRRQDASHSEQQLFAWVANQMPGTLFAT